MSHTKTAEPIEMPFEELTRVGPIKEPWGAGSRSPREGAILGN